MQEIKADVTDRIMTHDKPVVASRLSKINNQVFKFKFLLFQKNLLVYQYYLIRFLLYLKMEP
jgi:hypothetical protein